MQHYTSLATQRAAATSPLTLPNLQQAVRGLQVATTPARRAQALKLLQEQVQNQLNSLQVALAAGTIVGELRQEAAEMALGQLQQMQAWLSDPQRVIEAYNMSQTVWQGTVAIVTTLAGALLVLPGEVLKATFSPARI